MEEKAQRNGGRQQAQVGKRRREACWGAGQKNPSPRRPPRARGEFWGPEICPFLGSGTGERQTQHMGQQFSKHSEAQNQL